MNNRITINESENIIFKVPSKPPKSGIQMEKKVSLDLREIRDSMGSLWIPTYLPNDYELKNTDAIKGHALHLCFEKQSPKSILIIMESPKPANLHILPNTYKPVTIRGQRGFIVFGGWGKASSSRVQWKTSFCLWLIFEINEWIVSLAGVPAKAWSEQELVKVAESIREY